MYIKTTSVISKDIWGETSEVLQLLFFSINLSIIFGSWFFLCNYCGTQMVIFYFISIRIFLRNIYSFHSLYVSDYIYTNVCSNYFCLGFGIFFSLVTVSIWHAFIFSFFLFIFYYFKIPAIYELSLVSTTLSKEKAFRNQWKNANVACLWQKVKN